MVGEHQVWLLELSPAACINIMGPRPLLTVGECRRCKYRYRTVSLISTLSLITENFLFLGLERVVIFLIKSEIRKNQIRAWRMLFMVIPVSRAGGKFPESECSLLTIQAKLRGSNDQGFCWSLGQ